MTYTSQDEDYIQLLSAVDQLRRDHDRDLERKSRELLHEVENFRHQRRAECVRFLQGLMPLMEEARKVDREQDFYVAHRFNALRYLRNDELGLSNIIADLLDPSGAHGQGTTFLQAILELLSVAQEGAKSQRSNTMRVPQSLLRNAENILVEKERTIKVNGRPRRIDITVDIRTRDNTRYCLALENKPYAGDQQDQCSDYLEFLEQEYHERYLLVYLPPRKWMPSKYSLPDPKRWINHFCVLPYVAISESIDEDLSLDDSELADSGKVSTMNQVETADSGNDLSKFVVGNGTSLADWFGTCIARTHAERLRWFLREAQLFCQQDIGKSNMTDTEANYVKDHLEKNPEHANSAYAVARAWPHYIHGVGENFFKQLTDKVREKLASEHEELTIKYRYEGKSWAQSLSIYKESWRQYGDAKDHHSKMRNAIYLECHANLTDAYWGLRRARPLGQIKTESETSQRHEQLGAELEKKGFSNANELWLHWERPRYFEWAEIVVELVRECNSGEGEITKYFVNRLCEFVDRAIPVIDDVEGKKNFPPKTSTSLTSEAVIRAS